MPQSTLPSDFEIRLKEIFPQRQASLFGPRRYQSFRINTLKITVEDAHAMLSVRKVDFKTAGFCPYAVIVEKLAAQELLKSELVQEGLLYAQGLESLLPVIVLDPRPNQRVLDMCAAPGSKTSQIAMHMHNEGILKANEPVRQRLYRLKSVLQLTGTKAQISSVDGRRFKEYNGPFDRILVDAPCSTEGRFIINDPKSFAYWSVRKIKEMSHKQKGLLLNASRLLSPGGILVYATCTFAPEENEEVVDWFLRKTDGRFELDPIHIEGVATYPCLTHWQKRTYDLRIRDAARILPDERMEGFFIAKFTNSHYK
ncbi:MAG: RsmB/NOP family class I SAM-dependent RNA methyltransferase [Candidatus Omnitrophica bacterium]|nr:RsmB/NOP family class I SAM-dependent RNA methyltransferase [Candidatus Omnitrophota bacterium]